MRTDLRTWLRTADHGLAVVMLVVGALLVALSLTISLQHGLGL